MEAQVVAIEVGADRVLVRPRELTAVGWWSRGAAPGARGAEEIFDQTVPGRLVVITCEDIDGAEWRSDIVTIATPV